MRHGGGACISTGISRSSGTWEEDQSDYEYQRYLVRSSEGNTEYGAGTAHASRGRSVRRGTGCRENKLEVQSTRNDT
jgi:hypothetical protein